jgi:hypothetical protein
MICRAAKLLILFSAVGGLMFCAPKEEKPRVDLHEIAGVVKCVTPEDCGARVNCVDGACAQAYWKDDTDGGDDIWVAGCHWQFTDNTCTQGKSFYKGDYCTDGTHLQEFTDATCHTGKDRKSYDCNEECKKIGKSEGSCVTVPSACGTNNDSALCKCDQNADLTPIFVPPPP